LGCEQVLLEIYDILCACQPGLNDVHLLFVIKKTLKFKGGADGFVKKSTDLPLDKIEFNSSRVLAQSVQGIVRRD